MFNLAVTFIAAALVAPAAFAQDTSGISPCILNCTTVSLPAGGCTDLTDLACICTSTEFQTAAGTCIATDCPTEAEAAITLQTEQCAALGNGTASGSDSASVPASTPATGASTTRSVASGTTSRASSTGSTSRSASTSATSSTPNGGFHAASIASGVTLALFGAAFSLF